MRSQRDRIAADQRQRAEHDVDQRHQRHEHDQHGDQVEQQRHAHGRALGDGVHGALGDRLVDLERTGADVVLVRHHDLADHHRDRRAEHRGDDEMARGVGDGVAQELRVEHQHGAGDAGHAAGHHHEQFAARELREIGPDEQRRLDMADEDVGRGGKPDRAADAHGAVEREGEAVHHRRQDAPVEQQRGEHAHQQHDRQRVERQHEFLAGIFQLEGQRAAADIAEHEGGAGAARRGDRVDHVVGRAEGAR